MQARRAGPRVALTHFDSRGRARMVDVGEKPATRRKAVARGEIRMGPEVVFRIRERAIAKGDALAVAKIAGIMAAKRAGELIPLCHGLNLDAVDLEFAIGSDRVRVEATVSAEGRTGVEMEALTAVSVACLTIYDMAKALDKGMSIGPIRLVEKVGGRSGHYVRPRAAR